MSTFLHDRVQRLLFATASTRHAGQSFVDASLQLATDALWAAADHRFEARESSDAFAFYVEYAELVQLVAQQCAAHTHAPSDVAECAALLAELTATIDNVCRSLFCVRYGVRKAPKKLREALARLFDDLSSGESGEGMFVLLRLLHHTCGALNSINFRNVVWHGFLSAHEVDRLRAFAGLLQVLLLNVRQRGAAWAGVAEIPRIVDPLAPFELADAPVAVSDDEWAALVRQSPLVHRASQQERLYDGLLRLYRRDRRRDFCALAFTTLEASLRVLYTSVNASMLGLFEFQIDFDTLFLSYAMLLHDLLPEKTDAADPALAAADDGADAPQYAYRFVPERANALIERIPGDVLSALRELVFHLEIRDRLAHGLLPSDADVSADVTHSVFGVLVALLQCRFEPLPAASREARRHVPSFGPKRRLAEQLRRLECRADEPIAAFYRALGVDTLFVHEEHGRLARICANLCAMRDAAERQRAEHGDNAYFAALHDALYARCAALVRQWLAECEAARGAVASVRLARVETLTSVLSDCAQQYGAWSRMNVLVYRSGLSARDAREHDFFGGAGTAVLHKSDARFFDVVTT